MNIPEARMLDKRHNFLHIPTYRHFWLAIFMTRLLVARLLLYTQRVKNGLPWTRIANQRTFITLWTLQSGMNSFDI